MQLPSPSGVKGSVERGTEAVADITPTVSSVGRSCASNASFDAPTTPSTPSRSASLRFEAGARNLFVEGEWRGVVSSSGGGVRKSGRGWVRTIDGLSSETCYAVRLNAVDDGLLGRLEEENRVRPQTLNPKP
jgi:hypothetical protein